MKKICLLFSLLGLIYTVAAQSYLLPTPNTLDTTTMVVFDRQGNQYRLNDLKFSFQTGRTIAATCTAGIFRLHFMDAGTGLGFDDPVLGPQRQAVACQVYTDLSGLLNEAPSPYTSIPNLGSGNSYVEIQVQTSLNDNTYLTLATAGQFFLTTTQGIVHGAVWQTINSGIDSWFGVNGSNLGNLGIYHGNMQVNFGHTFYLGTNPAGIGAGQTDLYSVILHESFHALGFGSLIDYNGNSKFPPYSNLGIYSYYDTYLKDNASGNFLINWNGCYTAGATISPLSKLTTPCSIRFSGTSSTFVSTNPGWSNGTSLSHYPTGDCGNPGTYLMNPSIAPQTVKRAPDIAEVTTLCDIGYSTSGVYTTTTYPASGLCGSLIAGVNDYATYTTTAPGTNFKTPFNVAFSFSSANILGNDRNATFYDCLQVVNPASGSLGSSPLSGGTGNTITFTPTTGFSGVGILRYIPRVNATGKRGNITYIFIYVENDYSCTAIPCNMVLNGNFEQHSGIPQTFSQIKLSCGWNNANKGTCDYYHSLAMGSLSVPCNVFGYENDNLGLQAYAGMSSTEVIFQKLSSSLLPNKNYRLTLDVSLAEAFSNHSFPLEVYFQKDYMQMPVGAIPITNPTMLFQAPAQISNYTGWTPITINFTTGAAAGEDYIVIGNVTDRIPQTNTAAPLGLNGCNYTSDAQHSPYVFLDNVVLRELLPLTAVASPSTISPGQSSVLTATSSGVTYSWFPRASLTPSSTISNPTAQPTVSTTYTVTVTNASGCTATATVLVRVVPASCNIAYNYTISNSGANTAAIFGAAPTTISNQNISLQTNLSVNSNITFSNCNIVINPNVRIDLTTGNLTLTNKTHVFSCANMWDGIYVPGGRILTINGDALIEDAINAVVSTTGGRFTISQTIFNNNLIAVDARIFAGTHLGTIINSIITSRTLPVAPTVAVLKGSNVLSSYPTSVLKPPYNDRKGCYGINVTDVTTINIGSAATASNQNIFDWIMCGVNLIRSNVTIYNNKFQYIVGTFNPNGCPAPPTPCYFESGYGVKASGTPNIGTNTINVGGGGTNQPNTFNNLYIAIYVKDYQTHNIVANTISNPSTGPFPIGTFNYGKYGIFITSPTAYNKIYVTSHPLIQNCENAIFVNRNYNNALSTDLYIRSNVIKATSTGYCTNAIYVTDLQNGTYNGFNGSWSIVGNTITEAVNGVNLLNIKSPTGAANLLEVKDNVCTVRYAATGARNGILTKGCDRIKINLNHTKYTAGSTAYLNGGNLLAAGIYLESSTNMLLQCNIMDDAARNLVFKGNCTSVLTTNIFPTVGITQNTIHRAQDGFVLLTNGIIGTQGSASIASNNYWDVPANYYRGQTVVEGSGTDAINSKLYANSTLLPTSNSQILPGVAYSSASLINSSGSPIGCDPVRGAAPGNDPSVNALTDYANELKAMVDDVSKLPVFSDETHYLRKQFVYKELKNNASLKTSNTSLQNFYNNTKNNYAKFASIDDQIVAAQYSNANSVNNGIVAGNAIEKNQQTVNVLILKKLLNPKYNYTTADSTMLNNIAWQCPLLGGNSVYQARVLLMTIANMVIAFDDNCNVSGTRSLEDLTTPATQTNSENKSFKLYPNPNDGNMTFEYSLSVQSTGMFVLYDITGRVVNKYKLTEGETNSLIINEKELNGGIYFYSVIIDNTVKAYNKIVIVK